MEECPLLHNDNDCMTDVVDAYSNLQELIGKDLLPAQETHDLVEISCRRHNSSCSLYENVRFKLYFCVSIS